MSVGADALAGSTPAAAIVLTAGAESAARTRPFIRLLTMPLPLFLPCAAGVEALLAEETARLLPDAALRAARGGVSLAGDPHEVMVLNLESRLAQRVLIEVARDRTATRAISTRSPWPSPGPTGSRRARPSVSTPPRSAAR
jgi:hypothetical protein